MSHQILRLETTGPLIFRDNRPFDVGEAASRSLPFPFPSVVAGTVRTLLGKQLGMPSTGWDTEKLRAISVCGPILAIGSSEFYFPAPCDAVLVGDKTIRCMPISLETGEGVSKSTLAARNSTDDESANESIALIAPTSITAKFRADDRFWSFDDTDKWLAGESPETVDVFQIARDVRTHVSVSPDTFTGEDGRLFSTEGISISRGGYDGCLLVRVSNEHTILDTSHRMGGEGRFVRVRSGGSWPAIGSRTARALSAQPGRVRMQLATPAVFKEGWVPGWLRADLRGSPPFAPSGTELQLVGAVVPRWQPLSGWDLALRTHKPLRRSAPPGSTYLFEVRSGTAMDIAGSCWLQPMSDDHQDRLDGFGMALWGTWPS